MDPRRKIFKLKGQVQHYSWGGYDFIPGLLGVKNQDSKPFAEYWLGAHPNFPSFLDDGTALDQFIEQHPSALGNGSTFKSLPFLLKVLDVRQMLSIQVHPDKKNAEAGFAFEEQQGIPRNAAHRNYKDDNHKPELMVALGDFWLLHGFKSESLLQRTLGSEPAFEELVSLFQIGGYKKLYQTVMEWDQHKVDQLLSPLMDRILPLYDEGKLERSSSHFWAARAVKTFCTNAQYDRGIFSIYFFNLLHLKKGQGIYQAAGLPHAYLEGQNVELMANSDNVLRAGLTDKHIDIAELMKHTRFEATHPQVLDDTSVNGKFDPPVKEFGLHKYNGISGNIKLESHSPEIWLVMEGEMEIRESKVSAKRGEALFVPAGRTVNVQTGPSSVLFRAFVPHGGKN
jgi:mannose-6-phosphate isomerase